MSDIIVVPYNIEHYQGTIDILNLPSIQASFGRVGNLSLNQHKQWLSHQDTDFFYAIYFEGKYSGNIFYFINKTHKSAYFEIYLHPKFQKKGIGSYSLFLTMDSLFKERIIHRLWLRVLESNTKAIKLYEKLGFKFESIERESYFNGVDFENHLIYSQLSQEWRKRD